MIQAFEGRMVVLTDNDFHGTTGEEPNMKVCRPRTWDVRMVVETVLSMLTTVSHFKHMGHRVWRCFVARLAYTVAAFDVYSTSWPNGTACRPTPTASSTSPSQSSTDQLEHST